MNHEGEPMRERMKKPPGYRTSHYRCTRCAGVYPLNGESPGTHLSWTEPWPGPSVHPDGEGILEAGVYCPTCRTAIEAAASEIDSLVL